MPPSSIVIVLVPGSSLFATLVEKCPSLLSSPPERKKLATSSVKSRDERKKKFLTLTINEEVTVSTTIHDLSSDFGGDEDGGSEAFELDTDESWREGVDDENCVVAIDIVSTPSLGTVLSMLCRNVPDSQG